MKKHLSVLDFFSSSGLCKANGLEPDGQDRCPSYRTILQKLGIACPVAQLGLRTCIFISDISVEEMLTVSDDLDLQGDHR